MSRQLNAQIQEEIKRRISERYPGGREVFIEELKKAALMVPVEDSKNIELAIIYYNKLFFEQMTIVADVKNNYHLAYAIWGSMMRNAERLNCEVLVFAADIHAYKMESVTNVKPVNRAG